ncbi:hypothetical protein PHMEG_00037338, partial [Phytophthora megakarya]
MCPYTQHKMRYRLLECRSSACLDGSLQKCEWRGKTVTCLDSDITSIFEYGEHTSLTTSPRKKKLTSTQKQFCREMASHHLRPMRIRHALSQKFDIPLDDLPTLMTVQNFVNYYSRTYMENHDRVDEIRAWVHANAFTGNEPLSRAFTFGWEHDHEGKLIVGNGSDTKPFIVGL